MILFPGSDAIEELADEFKDYKISKGTVQFTTDTVITKDLVKKILIVCRDRVGTEKAK